MRHTSNTVAQPRSGAADQRTREIEALYRADETLYRSLRVDEVLRALVEVATDILQADMASVMVWDARSQRLVPGAVRGFRPESVARMSHARGEGITGHVLVSGEPIAVEDAPNDPRVVHRITDPEGIRSLLHVPIRVNGEVFGVFGVNYCQPRTFSGEEERLLQALAQRAGLAIANAHLFSQSEQRRRELEALYRADEVLLRSLRLDDVLQALVEVVTDLLNADKASVLVWDEPREHLVARAAHGYRPETIARLSFRRGEGIAGRVAQTAEAMLVEDLPADPRSSDRITAITASERLQSLICVPITVQGQVYGVFNVGYCQPRKFGKDDSRAFEALAQRAALAIENAHLYEQAQLGAVIEERQRLARELHDAVTQTLFSASLIAEVLPRLWERDHDEGRRRLEELRRLTRGALAEMRTLLLELRPAAFQEMSLPDLLRHLAESTSSRAGTVVSVATEGACPLPPEVQLALYRITQEALNNLGKHAGARQAEVRLHCAPEQVELRIEDDGCGFDPAAIPAGHLGLKIMRERAEAIGASLAVDSRVGAGTRLAVAWPDPGLGGRA